MAALPGAYLQPLRADDFAELAQLAATIWHACYPEIIGREQIDYMLAERYVPEKLRSYLDAKDRWMELFRLGDRLVGYCSYALGEPHNEMKLEQLYLLPELHGSGLGGMMLEHVERQARAQGCTTLLLQVNKRNARALAFYRKQGFAVRAAAVFDIGHGFAMDDYLMHKAL